MTQYKGQGFICDDAIEFGAYGPQFFFAGQIGCIGLIVIDVEKLIEYIGAGNEPDPEIQTVRYAYNVSVQGYGNLFRYDNAHRHPTHADDHHKHGFDFPGCDEKELRWVGEQGWPTLGDVIQEARDWHSANYSSLLYPVDCATNLRAGLRL